MRFLKAFIASLLATLFVAGTAPAADAPAPASKWRVAFTGQATTDGEMQFRLTPHEGEPVMVTARIGHGRGEVFIARDVCEAFKAQLPKKRFKSEIVAEKLLVKAGPGESDFTLELVESAVAGTRIHVTAN